MARSDLQLKVRLSPELHERIVQEAKAAGRSLNAEIVVRLRESLDTTQGIVSLEGPPDADELMRAMTLAAFKAQDGVAPGRGGTMRLIVSAEFVPDELTSLNPNPPLD